MKYSEAKKILLSIKDLKELGVLNTKCKSKNKYICKNRRKQVSRNQVSRNQVSSNNQVSTSDNLRTYTTPSDPKQYNEFVLNTRLNNQPLLQPYFHPQPQTQDFTGINNKLKQIEDYHNQTQDLNNNKLRQIEDYHNQTQNLNNTKLRQIEDYHNQTQDLNFNRLKQLEDYQTQNPIFTDINNKLRQIEDYQTQNPFYTDINNKLRQIEDYQTQNPFYTDINNKLRQIEDYNDISKKAISYLYNRPFEARNTMEIEQIEDYPTETKKEIIKKTTIRPEKPPFKTSFNPSSSALNKSVFERQKSGDSIVSKKSTDTIERQKSTDTIERQKSTDTIERQKSTDTIERQKSTDVLNEPIYTDEEKELLKNYIPKTIREKKLYEKQKLIQEYNNLGGQDEMDFHTDIRTIRRKIDLLKYKKDIPPNISKEFL
jgi:hypothetical protein